MANSEYFLIPIALFSNTSSCWYIKSKKNRKENENVPITKKLVKSLQI